MTDNPFKSFLYNALDDLGDPGDTEGILRDTFGPRPGTSRGLDYNTRQKMLVGIEEIKKQARPNQQKEAERLAWRCLSCNTINGLHLSSKVKIRKTCSKCAKPRTNPLTVVQEFHEIQRETLIQEWMKNNPELTLEEANKKFDESSEAIING